MAARVTEDRWIACPRCHIANIANGYCTACGAYLTPELPEPRYGRSGASPRQWALIVAMSATLILLPMYAGLHPESRIAVVFDRGLPLAFSAAALVMVARSVLLIRRKQVAWGITLAMVAILTALLGMAALGEAIRQAP